MVALAEVLTLSSLHSHQPESSVKVPSRRITIPRKEDDRTKTSYLEPYSENGKRKLQIKSISQPLFDRQDNHKEIFDFWVNKRKRWSASIQSLDFSDTRGVTTIGNYLNLINELSRRHHPPAATHFLERTKSYHDESMDFIAVNWRFLSQVLNPSEKGKFPPFCFREIDLFNGIEGGIPDHIAVDRTGQVYIIEVGLRQMEGEEVIHYKDRKLDNYKKRFMDTIGIRLGIIPSLVSVYVEPQKIGHKMWIQNPTEVSLAA